MLIKVDKIIDFINIDNRYMWIIVDEMIDFTLYIDILMRLHKSCEFDDSLIPTIISSSNLLKYSVISTLVYVQIPTIKYVYYNCCQYTYSIHISKYKSIWYSP